MAHSALLSFNPFHTARSHLTQQQACLKQWISSGQSAWNHRTCVEEMRTTAAQTEANPAATQSAAAATPGPRDAAITRTPYLHSLFPTMWQQEQEGNTCRRSRRPTVLIESASANAAAAAAAGSSSRAAESDAAPAAQSPPASQLQLRPRSPSRVLLAHLGPEHRRRVQAANFAAALIRATPHVSGSTVLPGPGDPMPGSPGASSSPGMPAPDGGGGGTLPVGGSAALASSASAPVLHKGSTRFSKPVADMGDYLGVLRQANTLRNPLLDQFDDPAYQRGVAVSMMQQQQQQQAFQQQQQQQQQAAAQQQQQQSQYSSGGSGGGGGWNDDGGASGDLSGSLSSLNNPRGVASPGSPASNASFHTPPSFLHHVDEAEDVLPPPLVPLLPSTNSNGFLPPNALRRGGNNRGGGGRGARGGGSGGPSDRRNGGGGGVQPMSWAQFQAARNGVAAAVAAAASPAASAASGSPTDDMSSGGASNMSDETASFSSAPASSFTGRKRDAISSSAMGSNDRVEEPSAKRVRLDHSNANSSSAPAWASSNSSSPNYSPSLQQQPSSPSSSVRSPSSSNTISAPSSPLLSNLLASMQQSSGSSNTASSASSQSATSAAASSSSSSSSTVSPPTASLKSPQLVMLRYRLESETGAREFAAAHANVVAAAVAAADGSGVAPSLEKHMNQVLRWFGSNVAALRAAAGSAVGKMPTTRPQQEAGAESEYEQLFHEYRAELAAKFTASPASQQLIQQRMQWNAAVQAA